MTLILDGIDCEMTYGEYNIPMQKEIEDLQKRLDDHAGRILSQIKEIENLEHVNCAKNKTIKSLETRIQELKTELTRCKNYENL